MVKRSELAMFDAILRGGPVTRMQQAVDNGCDVDHARTPPIFTAAYYGNRPAVAFLVEAGANVGRRSSFSDLGPQSTAMHAAAHGLYPDVVRYLLEQGAGVLSNSRRNTPLALAMVGPGQQQAEQRRLAIFHVFKSLLDPSVFTAMVLKPNEDDKLPLHLAAERGYSQVVQALLTVAPGTLNAGVGTSVVETPLVLAAEGNKIETARLLLDSGAVSSTFDGGAIYRAIEKSNDEMVNTLTQRAYLEQTGGMAVVERAIFFTILHNDNAPILEILLELDSQRRWVNELSFGGSQLLPFAAGWGALGCMSSLLFKGADEREYTSRPEKLTNPSVRERAVDHMLERGPAYRATSWAWPDSGIRIAKAEGSTVNVAIFRPRGGQNVFSRLLSRCEGAVVVAK